MDKLNYDVILPVGTTKTPVVTAQAVGGDIVKVVIENAESTSGTAKVTVTAKDGTTTQVYTIKFTVAPAIEWSETVITSVAKNTETNNPPYQLLQLNYNSNVANQSIKMKIIGVSGSSKKGKTNIKDVVLATGTVTDSEEVGAKFFQWSYRDLSTLVDLIANKEENSEINVGEELAKLERNNDYQLVAGSKVKFVITVGETVIEHEYTITEEDVAASTWEEEAEETPVTVSKVEITTAPTKVIYTEGEALDLTGLVVTLTKSEGNPEVVAFADFAANGLEVDLANGTVLATTHTEVVVTHTESSKSATQLITVTEAPLDEGDTTQLALDITAAELLESEATEGIEVGNYAVGSKATLLAAIADAQAVVNKSDPKATAAEVLAAEGALSDAVDVFEAGIVLDTEKPVIVDVLDANVELSNVAAWEAPVPAVTDNEDAGLVANIAYSSDDADANVNDLATARTHLATLGKTVKVTYTVSDAAGNAATPVSATFTAIADAPVNKAPTVVVGQETQTGNATPASVDGETAVVKYTEDVSAWFEDADISDTLTYSVVSATDTDNEDVSGNVVVSGNDVTYTPLAAQAGKEVTIVLKASDGALDSTGNITITVTVGSVPADARVKYTVTVASVVGGTADVTTDAAANVSAAGETVKITVANIQEGKEVETIKVTIADGSEVTVSGDNTFTMPAEAVTVTVTLKEIIVEADKDITSVKAIGDINVANGTAKAEVGLPAQVTLTLDDASEVQADVVWDDGTPAYVADTAGTYTFEGTITLPDNVKNTTDKKASVHVIVAANPEALLVQEYTDATDAATFVTLLDENALELTLTNYTELDAEGKTAVGAEMLSVGTFADKGAVQSAVTTAIAKAKVDSDARIANVLAVSNAKTAVETATYTDLEVADLADQTLKTAAVQAKVDTVKDTATATVVWNTETSKYDVTIKKGATEVVVSIDSATFKLSEAAKKLAAENKIVAYAKDQSADAPEAADYIAAEINLDTLSVAEANAAIVGEANLADAKTAIAQAILVKVNEKEVQDVVNELTGVSFLSLDTIINLPQFVSADKSITWTNTEITAASITGDDANKVYTVKADNDKVTDTITAKLTLHGVQIEVTYAVKLIAKDAESTPASIVSVGKGVIVSPVE